jgi:hypothetical protein
MDKRAETIEAAEKFAEEHRRLPIHHLMADFHLSQSRDAWTPVERLPEVDPNTDLLWRNRIDGAVSIHSYSGSSEMVMARYSHWMPIPPYEQEK